MAQYIISIFKMQLMIVFSWGFNSPAPIENGLKFHVNGYKYTGEVIVKYKEYTDLFDIEFTTTNTIINDVYADNLIDILDNHIEYCNNYEDKVKQTYNLK